MTELQLWQSIASLNCVEGLRIEIKGEEWVSVGTGSLSHSIQFKWRPQAHRNAALLIVDAIEASSDWRFVRESHNLAPHDTYWYAVNNSGDSRGDDAGRLSEHISLLTVIERVLGAIKEAQNG